MRGAANEEGQSSSLIGDVPNSLLLTAYYPALRDKVSWHAQNQLCQAAARSETGKMKALIFLGASPHGWNTTYSPIHFAARHGQIGALRVLLDEGVEVNSTGLWLQTPLMETVWDGHTDAAEFLLSKGADLYATDRHDGTALFQAASVDQVKMVTLLMAHGGKDCKDAESALSSAVERARPKLVYALLSGGVDPHGVTATYMVLPLLEVAEMNGDKETAFLLTRKWY